MQAPKERPRPGTAATLSRITNKGADNYRRICYSDRTYKYSRVSYSGMFHYVALCLKNYPENNGKFKSTMSKCRT